MTKYSDYRGLPVCYVRDNGALLLDDETATAYSENEWPTVRHTLRHFDMERTIYNLTQQSGARLPALDTPERESLREIIRHTINN